MKILHYIPSIDRTYGGTTTYISTLVRELGRIADVHVATHRSPHPVEMNGSKVHYIGRCVFGNMHREWLTLLDEITPDIVHVNCCWTPECAMAQFWAQKHGGYKVVLSPHGMLEPWIVKRHYVTRKLPALLLYQRRAVRRALTLVSTADSERDNLLKLGLNDSVDVVRLGIDTSSVSLKRSWQKSRRLVFLSRVHPKKGVEYLLSAVKSLSSDVLKGYTVVIAGEGEPSYVASLKRQIAEMGLADTVSLIGGVYGDDKWRLLCDADIMLLPTHSENFGYVVVEALACGTPVITTVGTPWRQLESEHCGAWIAVGAEPLTDALRRFAAFDASELEAMGRRGRLLVEYEYSARAMAESMMAVYKRVAAM